MKLKPAQRTILFIASVIVGFATATAQSVTKDSVTMQYMLLGDGGIKVSTVSNRSNRSIGIQIDGKSAGSIGPKQSASLDKFAYKKVNFNYPDDPGHNLWTIPVQKEEKTATKQSATAKPKNEKPASIAKATANNTQNGTKGQSVAVTAPAGADLDKLNRHPYFGKDSTEAFSKKIDGLCTSFDQATDKKQFITDNGLEAFIQKSLEDINLNRVAIDSIAAEIAGSNGSNASVDNATLSLVLETLEGRINTRQADCNKLKEKIALAQNDAAGTEQFTQETINYFIIGAVILLLGVLIVVAMRRKKKKRSAGPAPTGVSAPYSVTAGNVSPDGAIVVRRRTTSILKTQSLDDVKDNPAYLVINMDEYTADSAVRNIYIKDTCIKDIYNLYADDLRNTDKPKEDGCMVLGRWVKDKETSTYDISLEEVVFPGDDAVFKEYELNFGGIIKLRIAEKLRKLRRETNLQYDLVCWIHSHPGLGVFFSNFDDSVQMQLKHPQHPNFLIALVVDILTSDQETGIFTFRKDGTMNSKGDLVKMHSLEQMYQWALQSTRQSFTPADYYDILGDSKLKLPACNSVCLNNSAIIDLTRLITEPHTDIVGWAAGTVIETDRAQLMVVKGIEGADLKPNSAVIGCLISMAHVSIPTLQRIVAKDCAGISFVMVYTPRQSSLTTIPVINGELLADPQFFGTVTINDLKIWTRRKR